METRDTAAQAQPAMAAVEEERIFVATQWQLMWWKFRKHRMAIVGGIVIFLFYMLALFCEFIAPYDPEWYSVTHKFIQPQRVHFFDADGKFHLRPFVYGLERERDPETLRVTYTEDRSAIYPIYFFTRGTPYELWGFFKTDIHLFGLGPQEEDATLFLLGGDRLGRDMFSRVAYGSRISMSIGLVGVMLSLLLGVLLGGISGYYSGAVDIGIQRIIEFLRHMVPSFLSYIIASMTLSIPGMILSETSLSFLGLGLRPPAISWGVLLQEGQNVATVALSPWLLLPGVAVIIVVLSFNFLGDGLRDAADPYAR